MWAYQCQSLYYRQFTLFAYNRTHMPSIIFQNPDYHNHRKELSDNNYRENTSPENV